MAFKRYANSLVTNNDLRFDQWMEELRKPYAGTNDHNTRVAKTLLRKVDPNQYLLSHATIVASVDTYSPKNVKLGRQLNRGLEIDVRYPDFRIKPECHYLAN